MKIEQNGGKLRIVIGEVATEWVNRYSLMAMMVQEVGEMSEYEAKMVLEADEKERLQRGSLGFSEGASK